jgi:hypothetical protein
MDFYHVCVEDWREYTIQATSPQEAVNALVKEFDLLPPYRIHVYKQHVRNGILCWNGEEPTSFGV